MFDGHLRGLQHIALEYLEFLDVARGAGELAQKVLPAKQSTFHFGWSSAINALREQECELHRDRQLAREDVRFGLGRQVVEHDAKRKSAVVAANPRRHIGALERHRLCERFATGVQHDRQHHGAMHKAVLVGELLQQHHRVANRLRRDATPPTRRAFDDGEEEPHRAQHLGREREIRLVLSQLAIDGLATVLVERSPVDLTADVLVLQQFLQPAADVVDPCEHGAKQAVVVHADLSPRKVPAQARRGTPSNGRAQRHASGRVESDRIPLRAAPPARRLWGTARAQLATNSQDPLLANGLANGATEAAPAARTRRALDRKLPPRGVA